MDTVFRSSGIRLIIVCVVLVSITCQIAKSEEASSELAQGIIQYEELHEQSPTNSIVSIRLASLLIQSGEMQRALNLLDDVYNRSKAISQTQGETSQLYFIMGICSAMRNEAFYAEDHFSRAVALSGGDVVDMTRVLTALGLTKNARTMLSEALALNPDDESIQNALGEIYLVEGLLDNAIASFEKLEADFPDSAAYPTLLKRLYLKTGDAEKATIGFDRLIAVGKMSECDKYVHLARLYLGLGERRSALKSLQKAKKLDADDSELVKYFARYYSEAAQLALEEEKYSRASMFCRRVLEYTPGDLKIIECLGFTHMKMGDYEASKEYYIQALKGRPENPDFYANFALVLNETGMVEFAFKMVNTGLELWGSMGDMEAVQMLEEAKLEMIRINIERDSTGRAGN